MNPQLGVTIADADLCENCLQDGKKVLEVFPPAEVSAVATALIHFVSSLNREKTAQDPGRALTPSLEALRKLLLAMPEDVRASYIEGARRDGVLMGFAKCDKPSGIVH